MLLASAHLRDIARISGHGSKKIHHLLIRQDTVVLWSKSSTLDRKVEGSNPAPANYSFEVDDLDAPRKKEDGNKNRRARERPLLR